MSITNILPQVPETPVISPHSGCIYDRRLIEKYIAENGTDPINGEKLSIDDLIDVKTTPLAKPRPPSATSIPAILKSLQVTFDFVSGEIEVRFLNFYLETEKFQKTCF